MDLKLDEKHFTQPEWPDKPHAVGQSLCHWFDEQARKPLADLIRGLPPNPLLVELGTFIGAGSTMVALNARKDLRVLCLDHWAINSKISMKFRPQNAKDKSGRLCAFLRGEGTSLQHCQNNLFGFRDRVTLVKTKITHQTIDALADAGVNPDCVLIDDDHRRRPFVTRLYRCRYRWPQALIVCDDYCKPWQGVMDGVQEAFRKGFYTKEESQRIGRRMITFKRKSDGE